jgi:hypothetical protein
MNLQNDVAIKLVFCTIFLMFAQSSIADTLTQQELDRLKTEYELCPKLAEFYQGGNAASYLMVVDELKKRSYGKKCLKIAEISMNLRKYELAEAFRNALKEILEDDHPVETTRKAS